jgi:hypothetical protein
VGQNQFAMTVGGRFNGAKVLADMLAKVLTDQIGGFVEDQTDLKGVFVFRLDSRKGQVEVVLIDRVEKIPVEN